MPRVTQQLLRAPEGDPRPPDAQGHLPATPLPILQAFRPPGTHPTCQDWSFQTKVERMVNKGGRAMGRAEGRPGMQGSWAWGGGVGKIALEIPREHS